MDAQRRGQWLLVDLPGAETLVALVQTRAASRALTDAEAIAVARLALRAQEHYGIPQDVEWVMDEEALWDDPAAAHRPAGAPGRATGAVRVLQAPSQGGQLQAGDVLVAPMTNPDWLPTIRHAAALVTDTGGTTCHAAIVAHELGKPCVVGTATPPASCTTASW